MIRILILAFAGTLLLSCSGRKQTSYMTDEKAAAYLDTVKAICDSDNGALWGENLYGPVMIVDRDSRRIYSNFPDNDGILKMRNGIFTGIYPREDVISNYAVTFGNTLFAMAPLPREEDRYIIVTRCLHGLMHCYQIRHDLNLGQIDYNTSHMDSKTARLYTKLEWKALERSLRTLGLSRQNAIRDALVFRNARRELFPESARDENIFEFHEGIPAFTYAYLVSDSGSETVKHILEQLHRIYHVRSYSRSFGFTSGAIYTYLLHDNGFDLSELDDPATDLGELTRKSYGISLPEVSRDIAGSLAFGYDIDVIQSEEKEREKNISERFKKRTSKYLDKPVIFIELESPNFSFEPEDIDPIDSLGVIYAALRVSDNWGKIDIDKGGCLISNNLKLMRVPAKDIKPEKNHITGDGWEIILEPDWELKPVDDNYFIQKRLP